MRILGLDYGTKRVGIALSDPLGSFAQPAGFLPRDNQLIEKLEALIKEKEVSEIVLGLPLNMNNTSSEMSREVEKFAEILKTKLGLPVHLWDERLTTAASERMLVDANVRRDKRKDVRDSVSASLILSGFLRSRETPPQ